MTCNYTIRLDTDLRRQAEALFSDLGMSLATAFQIFLRQAVQEQGLPFPVRKKQPNKATLAAMKEALEISESPDAKTYASAGEMMEDILK
ncbi:MAG: type II toxin-antitoxin system RelB/DinJ family antitoxin [Kiritimatiellae bacterium]|nr:type II toxin-antitoxin system RelB/DinJ family antitoxin [Kiritimatiellia bacterium]